VYLIGILKIGFKYLLNKIKYLLGKELIMLLNFSSLI
jgi:hypothetical protein